MHEPRHPCCDTCIFFDAALSHEIEDTGACRRHAPKAGKEGGLAVWPFTNYYDHCGEWSDGKLTYGTAHIRFHEHA